MNTYHVAYNTLTGEVICCAHGNWLKKVVKTANATNKRFGYPAGRWIFSHKGLDGLGAKLAK